MKEAIHLTPAEYQSHYHAIHQYQPPNPAQPFSYPLQCIRLIFLLMPAAIIFPILVRTIRGILFPIE